MSLKGMGATRGINKDGSKSLFFAPREHLDDYLRIPGGKAVRGNPTAGLLSAYTWETAQGAALT